MELSGRTDGRAGGARPKPKTKNKHENQISGRLFVVVVVVGEREKRSVAHHSNTDAILVKTQKQKRQN